MRSALRIAGQALVALTFLAACGSSPSTVAKATPPSSPAGASILDDHFGFLAGDGVRSESDARPLFVLGIGEVSGVVSPDGSRLAYWAANELRVIQIAPNQKPHTVMTLTKAEGALYFAWSSDGTGLAVGVNAPVANPAPDVPPAYTAIRIVDVTAATAGPLTHANSTTAFSQFDPDILTVGSHVVVAWVDESSISTGMDIKVRTFDASLHAVSHWIDADHGGRSTDPAFLTVLAAVLVAGLIAAEVRR